MWIGIDESNLLFYCSKTIGRADLFDLLPSVLSDAQCGAKPYQACHSVFVVVWVVVDSGLGIALECASCCRNEADVSAGHPLLAGWGSSRALLDPFLVARLCDS